MKYPTKICGQCDGDGYVTVGLDDDKRTCFECGGMGERVIFHTSRDANGRLHVVYPTLDE